jgi:predicted nucleic acid-binding protein
VILVDTSVWIFLLRSKPRTWLDADRLLNFITCGPIIQELLQGLRDDPASSILRRDILAIPRISDPVSVTTFMEAAEIYRQGRQKGYTIRSSTDCLIAAIAIHNNVPVWHRDRDYAAIAKFTSLRAYTGASSR